MSLLSTQENGQSNMKFRAAAADFAFLSLLGGNDYLAAAIKRPKKGSKCHMEWLLTQYNSSRTSFMDAVKGTGPGGLAVWEFRIAKPKVLAGLLAGAEYGSTSGASLTEENQENCEEFLLGVLWAISTFANGCVPSYLSTCAAKVSVWTLIDYLRVEPVQAQALHVAYTSEVEYPVFPLTVAACVLPWRDPVLSLLGKVGPAILELVQTAFTDLFDFEKEQDAKQLAWARDGKWEEGANREAFTGLALRDLEDFDAQVKALADAASVQCKVTFSDSVSVHVGSTPEGPEESAKVLPLAKRQRVMASDDRLLRNSCQFIPGDLVEGYWPENNTWLPAELAEVHPDGSCRVLWTEDASQSDLPVEYVRLQEVTQDRTATSLGAGAHVDVYWPDDSKWLPAVLSEVHPDGSFRIVWALDESESVVPAEYVREVIDTFAT